VIRLSNEDDLREDLELAVMELQERGVATSSIRRYINSAIRATEDADGIRATKFLRQRWSGPQEASEEPSRPFGKAESSSGRAAGRSEVPDTQHRATAVSRSARHAERGAA
jgi:hypothetical protein